MPEPVRAAARTPRRELARAGAPSDGVSRNGASPNGVSRNGASLKFFHGPMDCGKSTLALQLDHNHARQGRAGLVLTRQDRSHRARVTTRIGLEHEAIDVTDELDLVELVRSRHCAGQRLDYLICDEANFYTVAQVEQMADLVDRHDIDVFAFGLATDFRSRLFPASQRLLELADVVARVQVEVLCWCGREGQLNARVVDGVVAREGEQIVIGDTGTPASAEDARAQGPGPDEVVRAEASRQRHQVGHQVRYQVLCRRHHRSGQLGPHQS